MSSMYEKLLLDLLNRAEIETNVVELQKSYTKELNVIIDKFVSIFELYNMFIHEQTKWLFEISVNQIQSPLKEKIHQVNANCANLNAINHNSKQDAGYPAAFFKSGNMIKKVCKRQKSTKLVNKIEFNNLNINTSKHDKEISVPQNLITHECAEAEFNLLKHKMPSSYSVTRVKPSITSIELIAISKQNDQADEYFNEAQGLNKDDRSSKSSSSSRNFHPPNQLLKKSFVTKGTILKNRKINMINDQKNLAILEKFNIQGKINVDPLSQQSNGSLININETASALFTSHLADDNYLSRKKPLFFNKFRSLENKANYIRNISSTDKADLINSFIGTNHNALDVTAFKNEEVRELKQLKNELSIYKAYIDSVNSKLEIEKKNNLKIQREYDNYNLKHNSILKNEIENLVKCFQTYRDFYEEELSHSKKLIEELLMEINDLKLK